MGSRRRLVRVRVALLGGAVVLLHAAWLAAAPALATLSPGRANEYSLKAALLYNIAKFVTWPGVAFPSPTAPLQLCVLGSDPFGGALEETVRAHQIGGHGLTVRRLAEPDTTCHVLFVASSEYKRLGATLERLRSAPVLTVSDIDGFVEAGGHVAFVREGESIHFHVNHTAASAAGLKLSARILEIAERHARPGGAQ